MYGQCKLSQDGRFLGPSDGEIRERRIRITNSAVQEARETDPPLPATTVDIQPGTMAAHGCTKSFKINMSVVNIQQLKRANKPPTAVTIFKTLSPFVTALTRPESPSNLAATLPPQVQIPPSQVDLGVTASKKQIGPWSPSLDLPYPLPWTPEPLLPCFAQQDFLARYSVRFVLLLLHSLPLDRSLKCRRPTRRLWRSHPCFASV